MLCHICRIEMTPEEDICHCLMCNAVVHLCCYTDHLEDTHKGIVETGFIREKKFRPV